MEGSQKYLNGQQRSALLCPHTCTRRSAPECLPWYYGNPPITDLLIHGEGEALPCQFIKGPPLLITSVSGKREWRWRLAVEAEWGRWGMLSHIKKIGWLGSWLIKQQVTSELNKGAIKNGSNPLLASASNTCVFNLWFKVILKKHQQHINCL